MTSTVKVTAHCASSKQVLVVRRTLASNEETLLQDGESHEFTVFDEISIHVVEEQKQVVVDYERGAIAGGEPASEQAGSGEPESGSDGMS